MHYMNLYQNPFFYAILCFLILGVQFIWLHFPKNGKVISEQNGRVLDLFFCFCTAVAVGTLFHLYPGNHLHPTGDSAAFVFIGKQMLKGKVPYLDYFDHKGPLLYLIEYAGLMISRGSTNGLWVVEVINMAAALVILVRLCFLASERRSSVWLALLITFIACGWRIYEGGNFTEEYALPWISLALMVFFRFFQTGKYSKWYIFLLGVAFSAVFLLRANMIAVWVACMPLVLICFLKEKRYRDLSICTGLFFTGVLATACPILLWLVHNNALRPFIECYFSFNLLYSAEVGMNAAMMLHLGKVFSLMILPGVAAFIISLATRGKDALRRINFLCFAISFLMLEMSGRDYPHYLITILPILSFSFADLFDWTASLQNKTGYEPSRMLLLFSCFCIFAGSLGYHVLTGKKVWPEAPAITWLKKNTVEKDDVLILGNDAWIYLASDRTTENRYFYQMPPIEISDEIRRDFVQELQYHPSDVIIDPSGCFDQAEGWRREIYGQLLKDGYTYQTIDSFSIFQNP